jgi:hypothetical protein
MIHARIDMRTPVMWRERLRATPNRSLRLIAYARECDNPIGPSVPQFRRRLRAPARLAAKRNADSDYTSTCKDGNRYHVFANAHGRVGTGALKALEIGSRNDSRPNRRL